MQPKHLAIVACLAILVAPTALASSGTHAEAATPPGSNCSGDIDFACWHIDCSTTLCIRMLCPVYMRHGGHAGGGDFGCF